MKRSSIIFLTILFEAIRIKSCAQTLSSHVPSRGSSHVSSHVSSHAYSHVHYIPHSHGYSQSQPNPSIPVKWCDGLIFTIKGDTLYGKMNIVDLSNCVIEYKEFPQNKSNYPDEIITLFGRDVITRVRLFSSDSTEVDYVNLTDKKNLYRVISEGKVSVFDSEKGVLIIKGNVVERIGSGDKKKVLIEKVNELFNKNFTLSDFKSEGEVLNWLKDHSND